MALRPRCPRRSETRLDRALSAGEGSIPPGVGALPRTPRPLGFSHFAAATLDDMLTWRFHQVSCPLLMVY